MEKNSCKNLRVVEKNVAIKLLVAEFKTKFDPCVAKKDIILLSAYQV